MVERADQVTRLLLFDIDGTLVDTLGAGVRSMNTAFTRLHGRHHVLDAVPVAGRTDRAIVIDAFRSLEIEPDEHLIQTLIRSYLDELPNELSRGSGDEFGILPGVATLLDDVDGDSRIGVGLLTGNFEAAARIKLGHFDLWRRFGFGAFGDVHVDRRDLVPVAMARAQDAGISVPMSNVVVIGDTPRDIECAHAHGAVAVAVATGHYRADELANAGADLVLGSLVEWDQWRVRA